MKYMGSKRELLERIEGIITKNLKEGSVVLDLLAGTCSVGLVLRENYAIYSNDIQIYSKIISKGTIELKPVELTKERVIELLNKNFHKNYNYVSKYIIKYISNSKSFKEIKRWDKTSLNKYKQFIKTLPNPADPQKKMSSEGRWLMTTYEKHRKYPKLFPYTQTTTLFSEMYFSVEQALEIDSIKYSIDNIDNKHQFLSELLNTALIHAYSYNSAGTGHFAQFRDLSTVSSVTDVFLYRTRSVRDYFFRKAEELILGTSTNTYYSRSKSFSLDYMDLLRDKNIMKRVGLVYADPPYSFVHYSRFYHAVEDLCRYDYPIVAHKGRYRVDRHQSKFCIKTLVPNAFTKMFVEIRPYKIPILVSYSDTGMLKLSEVENIAQKAGFKTRLLKVFHKHSTLGRLNDKDRNVTEALLMCQ